MISIVAVGIRPEAEECCSYLVGVVRAGNGLSYCRLAHAGWAMEPENFLVSVGIVDPVAHRSQNAFASAGVALTLGVLCRGVMKCVKGNEFFEEVQTYAV